MMFGSSWDEFVIDLQRWDTEMFRADSEARTSIPGRTSVCPANY